MGPSSSRELTRANRPAGSRNRSASSRARCAAISTVAASHAAAAAPPREAPLPRVGAATCGTDCSPDASELHTARKWQTRTCSSHGRAMHPAGTRSCAAARSARARQPHFPRNAPKNGFPQAPRTPPPAQAAQLWVADQPLSAAHKTRSGSALGVGVHSSRPAHRCALQHLRQLQAPVLKQAYTTGPTTIKDVDKGKSRQRPAHTFQQRLCFRAERVARV